MRGEAAIWCDGRFGDSPISIAYRGRSFKKLGKIEKVGPKNWFAWRARGSSYMLISMHGSEVAAKHSVEDYVEKKK